MSHRDVRGNLPGLVARIAPRTRSVPVDNIVLLSRAAADARRQAENEQKQRILNDIRNDWRANTDKMVVNTRIREMVAKQEAAYEYSVDQRRDRLRCLLQAENEQMLIELANMQETTEERKMKLRERARSLKERKECDRQEEAQRLRDQQFRDQCEELRTFLAQQGRRQLRDNHIEQIKSKQLLSDREKALSAYLDPLISGDLIAKEGRDESDAAKKHELECEAMQVLIHQRKAAEAEREREKAQQAEDAVRLAQERKLMAAENEAAYVAKKQKQAAFGTQLRQQMKERLRRTWFEQEQELAAELAETETAMAANIADIDGSARRKRSLMAELQKYRDYLEAEKEQRRIEQAELEQKLAEDSEEVWRRRCLVWKRDREARKALLQRVVQERSEQMAIKAAERANRKAGRAEEREHTEKLLSELRHTERAEQMRLRQQKDRYASELIGQMDYNARIRCMEENEKLRERYAGEEARSEYVTKMQALLANAANSSERLSLSASAAGRGQQPTTPKKLYHDHPFQTLVNQNKLPSSLTQLFT